MGREARAQAAATPAPVILDKGDYFELRAAIRDVEAVELDLLKAQRVFDQRLTAAVRTRGEVFARLAQQYHFDPSLTYRWDDQARSLIVEASRP